MSSYLSIYVRRGKDGREIMINSWSRCNDLYTYLADAGNIPYCDGSKDLKSRLVNLEAISAAIHEINDNLRKMSRQNELLKDAIHNNSESLTAVDTIISNEELIRDGREVIGQLQFLYNMVDDAIVNNKYINEEEDKVYFTWDIG